MRVAALAIPPGQHVLALGLRQQREEVHFAFHAQEVHVHPGHQLVADVAEDIKAGDEQVMHPLQQRVAHDESRLRLLANQPAHDRGAVEVAEDGQRGIRVPAIAIPDILQRRPAVLAAELADRLAAGGGVFFLEFGVA